MREKKKSIEIVSPDVGFGKDFKTAIIKMFKELKDVFKELKESMTLMMKRSF